MRLPALLAEEARREAARGRKPAAAGRLLNLAPVTITGIAFDSRKVEPGNLFMLAYHGDIPVVGAPGCARSKSYNVIDMVLPRLAAGERLARRDLVQLGHGGYLK